MNLNELASRQIDRKRNEAADNRARFPFAAEMLDTVKAGGIEAKIVYAANASGETIGKRELDDGAEFLPYGPGFDCEGNRK